MKRFLQYTWVLMILILSYQAEGQDSLKRWTINDCLQYAIKHNIDISTLRLNEQITAQDLKASKGAKIPDLYGSVGNTFNNSNIDAGNGSLTNQLNSTGSYSLSSSITLWNGNYINNTIQQRRLQQLSAGLAVNESVNNISLLIIQAFLNILLSKENQKYIADLVNTSAALVKQGQLFYDAGSVAKINLLQLQAQYASDSYLLIQSQNAIRQNTLALKQLLQLPTDSLFDIVTPDTVEVITSLPPLHTVQREAFARFPEMKIGKLGLDIASLDIKKARAGFKPTLSANGAIGSGYSAAITNPVFAKSDYFTQTGNNFYQRVGLSLTIPIFSNYINTTSLEKANIRYRQAGLNVQNIQLILGQAVERAYLNTSNAQQAFVASTEQLTAATESFRIINEQYKLGGSSSFEVLQLRNQYVQAVQEYTQAKYTAVLQYKIYTFYLGNPVTF